MIEFRPGQKWISNAEPELGMGKVTQLQERQVSLYFEMTGEERTYAKREAPLTRVKFNPGDEVLTLDAAQVTVTSVTEENGFYTYFGVSNGASISVVETELDPGVRFSKPEERLFTYQLDDNRWFNLRYRSLMQSAKLAASNSKGLYGPRVSLIPHQFYIANEVANRFAPRVLLADEVGLGKTIEAGLIIHQQLHTAQADRVLIIVPQPLTFQWFVEMIRRFNLQFTVLDESRCIQIEQDNASGSEDQDTGLTNPFEAQQLMLCSLGLFMDNTERLSQVLDTDWDLVVVDEAHHLRWTPENASNEYRVVDLISQVSRGLLLLTATPEQLGRTGHFARLRLLDPNRFHDYDSFILEESRYEHVANAVNKLLEGKDSENARLAISNLVAAGAQLSDDELIRSLLDRHGTGRVLFRNVRNSIRGLPRRNLISYPLKAPDHYSTGRFNPEADHTGWVDIDPRVFWLVDLLGSSDNKYLVICSRRQTAIELDKKIRETTTIRSTAFHEGMDLVTRDRSASYFSETYKGAQVMICSEIGSEGRNFQFASHLVMFDLPAQPDLIEQRIGRLDRIGQMNDVTIHMPYLTGTAQEKLFHWFHQGMDLFKEPNPVAQTLADELLVELLDTDLTELIDKTKRLNRERRNILSKGRDRLLELNSHKPDKSARIVNDVAKNQGGKFLEDYMETSFEMFGLESEFLGDGVFNVIPTESMIRNFSASFETWNHFHYPELPEEGIRITYDRETALAREDVSFFTWEHPIVRQALDIVLSDVTGNSTMIAIKHPALKSGTLLLETLHVFDCAAPAELNFVQFLPAKVLRCLITPNLDDMAHRIQFQTFTKEVLDVPASALQKIIDSQSDGIKAMLEQAKSKADKYLVEHTRTADMKAREAMDAELLRFHELRKLNSNVREEEIEYLAMSREILLNAIDNAQMRLDAIRIIVVA